MGRLRAMAWAALFAVAPCFAAGTEDKAYDLLFRNGTLNAIENNMSLVYRRDVTNRLKPEAATRDTGDISLSIAEDEARLSLKQGDKRRNLGRFPASVGNPMIMVFYESVVRDMAEAAGGSPFYIRNRVKDALVQPWTIESGEAVVDGATVPVRIVRMRPFAEDPNRARMQGFGDLELRVAMSEQVPGWYVSLVAETGGGDDIVYRSTYDFERMEPAQ